MTSFNNVELDDFDDDLEGESEYNDAPPLHDRPTVANVSQFVGDRGMMKTKIKAKKSDFVRNLIHLEGEKFSFHGRDYLRPIYDRNDSQILLKTARQVEKCVSLLTLVLMADGEEKEARDLVAGDKILSYNERRWALEVDTVAAVEPNGLKPIYALRSRFRGCYVRVTGNHPFLTYRGWKNAEELKPGDVVLVGVHIAANEKPVPRWDEIYSIKIEEEEETLAIEVTRNKNFVTGGFVTHNTTFLANNLVVDSICTPYYKSLYVSPSHQQTRQFSNEKLRPAIERSPLVARYYQDSFVSTQVFEKGMTNGSYIFLRSAFRSADRTRGISAQNLAIDEIQDFIGSEIPIIVECTSHYPDKARILYAGTPKSFENAIEEYWVESSCNEWLVKCFCGHWNFLDEHNIAPTEWYISGKRQPGPICKKCTKSIDPSEGKWITYNKGARVSGYRIPQLMVPWIYRTMKQWDRLLQKRDTYPAGQFSNEVLGISYDNSSRPLSREDVMRACGPDAMWNMDDPALRAKAIQESKRYQLVAGIDWGEGNDGGDKGPTGKMRSASYTVLTIGAYVKGDLFKVFYQRKYTGKEVEPDFFMRDILSTVKALNVKLVGADYGHGFMMNNTLIRELGFTKVPLFQYVAKMKLVMQFNKEAKRYMLQRNFMMSEVFFDIKNGYIEFPRWADEEPYAQDFLAIHAEYSEYTRETKFDHKIANADDAFHSLLICWLTGRIFTGKSRKYTVETNMHDNVG